MQSVAESKVIFIFKLRMPLWRPFMLRRYYLFSLLLLLFITHSRGQPGPLYLDSSQSVGTQASLYSLKGIKRVMIKPSASVAVKFAITPEMLTLINEKGERAGSRSGARSETLGIRPALQTIVTVR